MTIYEVIEKGDNFKEVKEFLCELLWGTSISNYDLYRPFLTSEVDENYLKDNKPYDGLFHEIGLFVDRELILIARNIVKYELKDVELVDIITNSRSSKEVIVDHFKDKLGELGKKHITK